MDSLSLMAFNPVKARPPPKRTSLLAKQGFTNVTGTKGSGKKKGSNKKELNVGDDLNLNKKGKAKEKKSDPKEPK